MIQYPLAGTSLGIALEQFVALAILSLLTKDYSWLSRLWSVVPRVYCPIVDSVLEVSSLPHRYHDCVDGPETGSFKGVSYESSIRPNRSLADHALPCRMAAAQRA